MRFLTLLFVVGLSCFAAEQEETKSWKHPDQITYESLRAWHKKGGLQKYIWPKEHRVDLNENRTEEVLLGLAGYSRGMTYALFVKTENDWLLLSDEIEGSHHLFELLEAKNGRWHDFKSLLPSGRGGLFEFIYTWNGKSYIKKSSREITHEELQKTQPETPANSRSDHR